MGIVLLPTFGADPVTITGPTLDAKVDGLATEFNGSIDNANIDAGAAIANSKLNLASISQNITHSGTMTHSGTLTMTAKDISEAKGADIASATTTECYAADGNFMHITGTTTITSLGTAAQAGDCRTLVFDGALTLTHDATSLILPTGANITTAAGDVAIIRAESTANTRVVNYYRKDGSALIPFTPSATNALAGSVVKTVNTQTGALATGTTTMPQDDTIPQNTEGDEYMTLAITPTNANNKLRIDVLANIGSSTNSNFMTLALFQDSTAGALCAATLLNGSGGGGNAEPQLSTTYYMTAGTTSETTFKVRIGGANAATTTLNGKGGARLLGGVQFSSITITEIKV